MDFDLRQEIREMVHGLGEKRQRKDAMVTIQSVLFNHMALIISKAQKCAFEQGRKEISIKDVVYVLQNHKYTLIRLLRYYLLKENLNKFTTISSGSEQEHEGEHVVKRPKKSEESKTFDNDIAEATLDFDFKEINNLDPISALAAQNNISKAKNGNGCIKKNSIYKSVTDAILELNLNISITKEDDVKNATEARKIRAAELSVALSPAAYECFQICRRKVFHNKTGDLLLKNVQKAIPLTVTYKQQVEDIFFFLAKETIACLIDRVYENRKKSTTTKSESLNNLNGMIPNSEVKNHEALLVEEITDITTKTWNLSLVDIHIPFEDNDNFFDCPLIFD